MVEDLALAVEPIEPAERSNPQSSRMIFVDDLRIVMRKRRRVSGLVPEDGELVTIESVQAIGRSKPHVSGSILEDAEDNALRETIFHSKVIEAGMKPACNRKWREEKDENVEQSRGHPNNLTKNGRKRGGGCLRSSSPTRHVKKITN